MSHINFTPVWDSDLDRSIRSVIESGSELKKTVFKTVIMKNGLKQRSVKLFESAVNDFLKTWADHAEELRNAIKGMSKIKGDYNIHTIEYEYVKGFIYGKYDYASVLQFTDGIMKGISDGKFTKPEQIEDFKEHTISMAFDNMTPSVPGLMDSVLTSRLGEIAHEEVSIFDMKMFENVRRYNDLFNRADRIELYKSIGAVIDYLLNNKIVPESTTYQGMKMFTSLINNVVEYIIYSLTAYAGRIYIISQYCRPFITAHNNFTENVDDDKSMTESGHVDLEGTTIFDVNEDPNGHISNVFRIMDDTIIKDPEKGKEFFNKFEEFIKLSGVDSMFDKIPSYNHSYAGYNEIKDNKIHQKLLDNPLYTFLVRDHDHRKLTEGIVTELHHNIKSLLHNTRHALETESTPRQDMIHHIRGTVYEDTLKGYQTLAKDLYVMALKIYWAVVGKIDCYNDSFVGQLNNTPNIPQGSRKLIGECTLFMTQFYEEIMFVFAQKMRFIERRINELRASDVQKMIDNTTIDIPGLKSDVELTHYTAMSAPETLRMPIEDLDLYTLPVFEEITMYQEYLASLPEFKDDPYFTEATAGEMISKIIAAIRAKIKGLTKTVLDFIRGQQFKMAQKWVIENEEAIRQIDVSKMNMDIKPYLPTVNVGFSIDKFSNEIRSMNINEVIKNPTEFIKSLYAKISDNKTAEIFIKYPPEESAIRYRNLVLYNIESNRDVPTKSIHGEEIRKSLLDDQTGWVNNIKKATDTVRSFQDAERKISGAIDEFNSKIAAASQPTANIQTTSPQQNGQQDTNQSSISPNASLNELAIRIQKLIDNLWAPIPIWERQILIDQYSYIKEIFVAGNSSARQAPGRQAKPTQQPSNSL